MIGITKIVVCTTFHGKSHLKRLLTGFFSVGGAYEIATASFLSLSLRSETSIMVNNNIAEDGDGFQASTTSTFKFMLRINVKTELLKFSMNFYFINKIDKL